ncbi:hypothetical protein C4K39_4468 [Pseudomonas sessilinigenes]|nr:hypothetical protein C4K39_4468 [Pseudomonas sessilinigenes]
MCHFCGHSRHPLSLLTTRSLRNTSLPLEAQVATRQCQQRGDFDKRLIA